MKLLFPAVLFFLIPLAVSASANLPELPRLEVDARYPSLPSGHAVLNIRPSCGSVSGCFTDLQKAIDSAEPGDEIIVEAGMTVTGPITLKKKAGDAWIVIRSSRLSELPAGTRVGPAQASLMPKIISPGRNQNALNAENGAHHYRIAGVEFGKSSPSAVETNLIYIGRDGMTSEDQVPHHIVFDRVYAHGDPTSNLRRCMTLNSAHTAVIDSHLSDCHEKGADSQAIGSWNGPGPFLIENNYLAGSGENVMFGGATPKIRGLVPSDIVIRRNHFHKPLSWKEDSPSYAGHDWVNKNLFELKAGNRVLVDGNLFENSWTDGQSGPGILLKSANPGGCDWCRTSNVTFRNNIVKNVESGFVVNAAEGERPWPPAASRIHVDNNYFEVSRNLFSIYNGVRDLTIERNTALGGNRIMFGDGGSGNSNAGLTFRNNLFERGTYGFGVGSTEGTAHLDKWFKPWTFEGNVLLLTGEEPLNVVERRYPTGTRIEPGTSALASRSGEFALPSNTPWNGAGADIKKIETAVRNAAALVPSPPPPSPPSPSSGPSPAPSLPPTGNQGGGSSQADLQNRLSQLLSQLAQIQTSLNSQAPSSGRFERNLYFGLSDDADVRNLQARLLANGSFAGPVTGNFLGLTFAGVKKYQAKFGVPATGFVGPLTREILNSGR